MAIDKTPIVDFVSLQERVQKYFTSRAGGLGKKTFYFQKIGMSKTAFNQKLRNKSFSADELSSLIDAINESDIL
jgi:hypothetical protein